MSFQANRILRKLRSSQDSKSANIFNGSECQNTDNGGYLRLSTTSETQAVELNLNLNGSSVAASSTRNAIDVQSNTSKNIEYSRKQNLLHEKLSRSFSSLLNQNSNPNPNTNFIYTRFGRSDLKIEMEIELQKCYETIRVLRTENKTLWNEKKLIRQQSEQQKLKSDNIIADLRCRLALAKAGLKNTSKLSNTICSNLRKGSRFAKPLNDAPDANTIHTLAQQFVDKIKPDNNLNSNALNNSHRTESEQYNGNVHNESMISGLNVDLNYSSNTSHISYLSQPHRLEQGNDNPIIDNNKSFSVDDDALIMSSTNIPDNNNKTTFINILLDTITGEGINSSNMINNDNSPVNNQNNFIPLTSSPSQQHFQPFLRPSLLFNTSNNTNTNSCNDVATPHSTSNISYVTPIPTIDSKQYQQHNAQQIHQLELMQNMYRNHLHQISLRTNQAQKLNMQQRVSSKKDNIPNVSYNSSNTVNNKSPSHYLSNDHLQQTSPSKTGNTNITNITNNNNHNGNSSSAASSPTKEDIDPRYARPVWNRNSPLSSPHKNNCSSVQQQLYPQQYHHLQQLHQQQQTSTFLNYPSTQFQSQPQTYASSASAFNHFTLADLADVKKYNSYNNNSNNNNNHENTDSNANSSHTSANNNNNNNNSIDNRYTITSSNTLNQIAANLIYQTNNSNEYHDDNTHESDDESVNLEFDLNSYL